MVTHGIEGSPIVPPGGATDPTLEAFPRSCVTLADYQKLTREPECQFWGVRNEDSLLVSGCNTFWTEDDREDVAFYLNAAQNMIEEELTYPMCRTWITGEVEDQPDNDDRFVEQRKFRPRFTTKWGYVVAGGVKATSDIDADSVVDHSGDPAIVGPIATTVTDVNEVKVYYPDTDREITPSKITISGGNVTIYIPRCRMVRVDLLDTTTNDDGIDYTDTSLFQGTVDVVRVYNDESVNAVLVRPHTCTATCAYSGCSQYTSDGCIYVKEDRLGIVDVRKAAYSGGSWAASSLNSCNGFRTVRMNYLAGLLSADRLLQLAVIRLAHTLMPSRTCGCDQVRKMWEEDNVIPQTMTVGRAECPFGLKNGAWFAWQMTEAKKIGRGSGTDMPW